MANEVLDMTYDATNKTWFYRPRDRQRRYDPEFLARMYREILVMARGQVEHVG